MITSAGLAGLTGQEERHLLAWCREYLDGFDRYQLIVAYLSELDNEDVRHMMDMCWNWPQVLMTAKSWTRRA